MEEQLNELNGMNRTELLTLWQERFSERCLMRSAELLRRRIAWRMQEEKIGGLKPETKRHLHELSVAFAKDMTHKPKAKSKFNSGTTLTRLWKGKTYTVKVLQEGFLYRGEIYQGLSKIAREITGTRWSGPLFFGVKKPTAQKRAKA